MCTISTVYDEWNNKNWPWTGTYGGFQLQLSMEEICKLREMIAEFYKAKELALELDKLMGQPDCLDPEKAKLDEKITKLEEDLRYIPELNRLRDEALKIAIEHGFTDATPVEDIALMHSELSELLEDIRSGFKMNEMMYEEQDSRGKPIGVPSELADVIIRALHFAGKHNIDIDSAVREKMAYNSSRPFKHGKIL